MEDRWTGAEEDKLILLNQSMRIVDAVESMNRTYKACRAKMRMLKARGGFADRVARVVWESEVAIAGTIAHKNLLMLNRHCDISLFPQQDLRNDRNRPVNPY